MNELFDIIAQLLRTETCVIVPDFGGFVANRKSAQVDAATGKFCPPMVQVVFNAKLKHNDGLVTQAWAARYNCSISEAGKQLKTVVSGLWQVLEQKGSVVIPQFGTLCVSQQGCSFVSSISQEGFSEAFGLQEFYVPALKPQGGALAQARRYAGAGVAAALAAMLFFPFSKEDVGNMASFFPVAPKTYCAAGTLNAVASSASQMDDAARIFAAKQERQQARNEEDARFYIVLKRFANAEDASAFVQQHQSRMSDNLTVMAITDNFYAVSCANTKNPDLAGRMMDNVRNNSSFKDTFILYK